MKKESERKRAGVKAVVGKPGWPAAGRWPGHNGHLLVGARLRLKLKLKLNAVGQSSQIMTWSCWTELSTVYRRQERGERREESGGRRQESVNIVRMKLFSVRLINMIIIKK